MYARTICWLVVGAWLALASPASAAIVGRWLGQDQHDFCGADGEGIRPNGVQDVHIALAGLPPGREIVYASIHGHGSDEWQVNGVQNRAGAVLQRGAKSPKADLYFEPYHAETGREFAVKLRFDDGKVVEVYLKGGRADPALRMLGVGLSARWVGQGKLDHAGLGPGVGPDGLQDARIALFRLSKTAQVAAVDLVDPSGVAWTHGPNPAGHHNAEFEKHPTRPDEGHLLFQAGRNLAGVTLKLRVTYDDGKTDATDLKGGLVDPKLAMPRPTLPRVGFQTVPARWLGQDGSTPGRPGDVHVRIGGLPDPAIAAVFLTDGVRGIWAHHQASTPAIEDEPGTLPLSFRRSPDGKEADLHFAPVRDEANTSLSLRFVDKEGRSVVTTFPGGPVDLGLTAPAREASEIEAKPGDDLGSLAGRFGTVRLAAGEYPLKAPLILAKPVKIVGGKGTILRFAQEPGSPPWTAAIKIHAGNTHLEGFAVRFQGPIQWRSDVAWGPAVIGTTDPFDKERSTPKSHLVFQKLDLEGPAAFGSTTWVETPKLLRLVEARNGRIARNRLRGGLVDVFEGPWIIEDNTYSGTPVGTFTHSVFTVHEPHDVVVRNNLVKPTAPSGKTWRFLAFTQRGAHDVVEGNRVEGIGPRDDDKIPSMNAPEIVLTESYRIWFEGKPSAVSGDGRVVKIGHVDTIPARSGDVVSVLKGQGAGDWRKVVQRLDPTTYVLDAPIRPEVEVIAISPGFVGEVFRNNTIDASNGRAAAGIVLAGNHFGTQVVRNTIQGAGDAFQISAYPSESPRIWGWSHAPFLGGLIEGNTLIDSENGGRLGVFHGGSTKSNQGRVYMTAALKANTVRWTGPFLERMAKTPGKAPKAGITLGYPGSIDPAEFVVSETGTTLEAPGAGSGGAALKVIAAVRNGKVEVERSGSGSR